MTITDNNPVQKQVAPVSFLFFRTETTLPQLGNFFHVANELYAEAVKLNLHVTGPIHWHYFGFEGDPHRPFTLEISLPVNEIVSAYDGPFHFKRTEIFRCVSMIHEGDWLQMGTTYAKLMKFAVEQKLSPAVVNRELYVNVDFANPHANVTEVQLGIQ